MAGGRSFSSSKPWPSSSLFEEAKFIFERNPDRHLFAFLNKSLNRMPENITSRLYFAHNFREVTDPNLLKSLEQENMDPVDSALARWASSLQDRKKIFGKADMMAMLEMDLILARANKRWTNDPLVDLQFAWEEAIQKLYRKSSILTPNDFCFLVQITCLLLSSNKFQSIHNLLIRVTESLQDPGTLSWATLKQTTIIDEVPRDKSSHAVMLALFRPQYQNKSDRRLRKPVLTPKDINEDLFFKEICKNLKLIYY